MIEGQVARNMEWECGGKGGVLRWAARVAMRRGASERSILLLRDREASGFLGFSLLSLVIGFFTVGKQSCFCNLVGSHV